MTCWEIFTGGKNPYSGINPADLIYQLKTGFRMEKPHNAACDETMYVQNITKPQPCIFRGGGGGGGGGGTFPPPVPTPMPC